MGREMSGRRAFSKTARLRSIAGMAVPAATSRNGVRRIVEELCD